MIPISLGDIVKICDFLAKIILDCINATKEQAGLRRTFEILQGKIDHYIQYMHDYILNPNQLRLWHTTLTGCEAYVSQLHKNLTAGSTSHHMIIWRAMFILSGKRDAKLAADLQKEIENLASVYELLVSVPNCPVLYCCMLLTHPCSSSICQNAPKVSHLREVLARP